MKTTSKTLIAFIGLLAAQISSADRFALLQTNPPAFNGPYEFRHGSEITIGTSTFTLAILRHDDTASEKKAKRILFPVIEFKNARFEDVVSFLREHAREYDPEAVGVNILIKADDPHVLGQDATRSITLNLKRVSLYDALCYSAALVGFDISADQETLFVINHT